MRSATIRAAVLTLLLLLAHASVASAQPVFDDLPTLEWRTAQADLVLAATIASVGESTDEWGVSMVTVELRPVEVFKGRAPRVIATMPNSRFRRSVAEGLTERMEAGHADAWFLVASEDEGALAPIGERIFTAFLPLEDPPSVGTPESWLRRPLPPAVTMDLVRHDGKDAVVDALRRIVEDEPPHDESRTPPWGHRLQLSFFFVPSLWPECGNLYHLTVPADSRLEALARRMIERPASFFEPLPDTASDDDRRSRSFDESSIRREGARALAIHFESPENARLLATLLDDTSIGTYQPSGLAEPTRHLFTTRKIAFDALTEWGVEVPEVELEAPMVDASIAPSPEAFHAVHGPRMEGLVSTEFLIELGGDRTPELLRLTYLEAKGGRVIDDLEGLRRHGAFPFAFTVFAFADGEAIPVFHAGSDNDGIWLQLMELGGTPSLVYQLHTKDPTVYACGWWGFFADGVIPGWQCRTGHWIDDGRDVEFTGAGPLIWYCFSK